MDNLDEKVAMITGCVGGFGNQHAIRFAWDQMQEYYTMERIDRKCY